MSVPYKFDPLVPCRSVYRFIITDEKEARGEDGVKKLRVDIHRDLVDNVPFKYRKYCRVWCDINKAPEESTAGWEYDPKRN